MNAKLQPEPQHRQWLQQAIALSEANVREGRGGPFGAVIVKNGEVVGSGTNLVTTHHDPTAHAEVLAIREAGRKLGTHDLRGCVLYASCEPCPMCLGAILWARIDAVYFANNQDDAARAGFDDAHFYREVALPPEQRELPMHWLVIDGAGGAFRLWDESPGKVLY
jgi:guanine deaminase